MTVHNNSVVKIFDTSDHTICPNVELLQAVGAYNSSVINLTKDGRFVMLAYTYSEGDQIPTSMEGFAGVVGAPHIIHEQGFVHGDVRAYNIVFSQDSSFLIEYNLARKAGARYPIGFVHYEQERHPAARAGYQMYPLHDPLHDRYALGIIIQGVATEQANSISARFMDPSESLECIATELDGLP